MGNFRGHLTLDSTGTGRCCDRSQWISVRLIAYCFRVQASPAGSPPSDCQRTADASREMVSASKEVILVFCHQALTCLQQTFDRIQSAK